MKEFETFRRLHSLCDYTCQYECHNAGVTTHVIDRGYDEFEINTIANDTWMHDATIDMLMNLDGLQRIEIKRIMDNEVVDSVKYEVQ